MKQISEPIFKVRLDSIKWKKIYAREYGVQYSEMALLCLSPKAKYHIPTSSVDQVIIPDGVNTAFYIDEKSWNDLIDSLNQKYTSNISELEKYEKQFTIDGKNYERFAERISNLDLSSLTNNQLIKYYKDYQEKLFTYSVYAWSSFILNIYVADRANKIIDQYITKNNLQERKQEIIDSLFQPPKRAAVLELQHKVEENNEITDQAFKTLYEKYKWLSCLDLHNRPWTEKQFKETLDSFKKTRSKKVTQFDQIEKELNITKEDSEYLHIAKRFVYLKDARDDFRRKGVYLVLPFFTEIAKRMNIKSQDITYIQSSEVINFLEDGLKVFQKTINERKKGFVMYLDDNLNTICLQSEPSVTKALNTFHFEADNSQSTLLKGRTACNGIAKGKVAIVHGIKDLRKVREGSILVAVTTHPDYTTVMRIANAIVTDEGGITSHAAIVSREYNIPCIVGTHNATKVLREGDLVEVNATEGWIKKIE